MNPHRVKAYTYLIIVSVIWAIAGPVIKYTLGGLDPLTFLFYRFSLSATAGVTSLLLTGRPHIPVDKKTLSMIFLYGFITTTITLGLLFFGLEQTTVLDMSIMSVAGPLIIAYAGVHFLNEHITKKEKVGMGIAVAGMLFTTLEPLVNAGGLVKLSGNILILAYLVGNAISVVLLKKLLRENIKPGVLTNLAFIIGFITILPAILIKNGLSDTFQSLQSLEFPYHLGVFYMAFLSGNLAYFLGNKAQKTIEVSEAALFSYLYPILSIPIAVLWLQEKITLPYIMGAVIIVIGVIIAEYKKKKST